MHVVCVSFPKVHQSKATEKAAPLGVCGAEEVKRRVESN